MLSFSKMGAITSSSTHVFGLMLWKHMDICEVGCFGREQHEES